MKQLSNLSLQVLSFKKKFAILRRLSIVLRLSSTIDQSADKHNTLTKPNSPSSYVKDGYFISKRL